MSQAALIEFTEPNRQGELGQFFTPASVAAFMASLLGPLPPVIRLLDAGAGTGALTEAFISRICKRTEVVSKVEATLYEIDPAIQDALLHTMEACERSCAKVGIRFSFTIYAADFIKEMSSRLSNSLFNGGPPAFDVAIVNPPYRKIGAHSSERRNLRYAGIETSNLYAGFIALIHRLLVPDGQLVAITPRSFCNGPYFRLFREDFLNNMQLRRLHVFDSRRAAFREDSVLQENIIFHATKTRLPPDKLIISNSSGEEGDAIVERWASFDEIVNKRDAEKFIHIPTALNHAATERTMTGLHASLASLGLMVSTGRVVDFRLKEALRWTPEVETVPLLYPCHFNGGTIHWPKLNARKPNAILDNDQTRPWLIPSGLYLLTKRFTSKEERRRLVACLFDPEAFDAKWLGLENHLNYFHANGRGLQRNLALGLFAFLNSTVVDQYFRRFSGHTQVNATDLRKLAYPCRDVLEAMGSEMKKLDQPQYEIDMLVDKYLHAAK